MLRTSFTGRFGLECPIADPAWLAREFDVVQRLTRRPWGRSAPTDA